MKSALTCCLLTALLVVGCRKKKPVAAAGAASEAATSTGAVTELGAVNGNQAAAASAQTIPTLKGIPANSDHPIAKALAGNDTQAHLRVLNELLMVWDQSQGKPLLSPDDFVKAGLLSRLPSAPPGMKFSFNANKRQIELAPAR